MSEIVSISQLSKELGEHLRVDIDSALSPFQDLLPDGWRVDIEHTLSPERVYSLTIKEGDNGKIREITEVMMKLMKNEPHRVITGEDSIDYIKELARRNLEKTGRILPIYDHLIGLHRVDDLTYNDHEWLYSHFSYTKQHGGLRLKFNNEQEIIVCFNGTHQNYDLYFAIQVAKLYVHALSIPAELLASGFSALKNFPIGKFWLELSQN